MGGVPGGTALSCSQFWLFVCFFGPSAAETGSAPPTAVSPSSDPLLAVAETTELRAFFA